MKPALTLAAIVVSYVRTRLEGATGERDYLAFRAVGDAVKSAQTHHGSVIDWPGVMRFAAADAAGD